MKKLAISTIRAAGHVAMMPVERSLMANGSKASPPVFIIGAPRSGTSLLYELMITRFRFAYMSNAAHRFYRTPLTASRLFRGTIREWEGNFTSKYGHIDGWGAPNEGGWIWQRWLADGDWRDADGFGDASKDQLRRLTAGLETILGGPFLNKNVMHSNRLRLMDAIWPDALFVEVKRDVLDNARSIVRAERVEAGPDKHGDIWWSVRPKLASSYAGKPDTERAIAQVIGVERDIAEDVQAIGSERLLSVDYSEMCAAPEAALSRIRDFAEARGCTLQDRGTAPDKFPVRPSKPMSDADEASLQDVLSRFR